jgi:RNA polymerase subunit RPABC4/transcription elongation factor Spt4
MSKCPTCNLILDPGQQVCPNCGPVDWEPVCANCHAALGSKQRFCPKCGADSRPMLPRPMGMGCAFFGLFVGVILIGVGASCALMEPRNPVGGMVNGVGWISVIAGSVLVLCIVAALHKGSKL